MMRREEQMGSRRLSATTTTTKVMSEAKLAKASRVTRNERAGAGAEA
mgnify:CR=1 FL=1